MLLLIPFSFLYLFLFFHFFILSFYRVLYNLYLNPNLLKILSNYTYTIPKVTTLLTYIPTSCLIFFIHFYLSLLYFLFSFTFSLCISILLSYFSYTLSCCA